MTFVGFHGDPCYRCPESRPGKPVLAAVAHGMCSLCWLGATERQRRDALFDEAAEHAEHAEHRRPPDPLEALFALPAVDPEPWQHGEAA